MLSGPNTDGSTARVTEEPLVPSMMRLMREPGPIADSQAWSRTCVSRENSSTSGSRVIGSTVATCSFSYSLRAFHARNVRATPTGSDALACTTSMETGRAAKGLVLLTAPPGRLSVKDSVWEAATVGSVTDPSWGPVAAVAPVAQVSIWVR